MTSDEHGASFVDAMLNAHSVRALALTGDESVLDVGCGYGELTSAIAGSARHVVGVDHDPVALASARARESNVDFRHGDAAALPLRDDEWGSFDVAHARFVLESLADPHPAVAQMVSALRPGGRIVLADDDHETLRLRPDTPRLLATWDAYMRSFDIAGGGDARVGRKLVAILHACGARPARASACSLHTRAGDETFADAVARLRSILTGDRDGILATGLVDAAGFDAALDELAHWSRGPGATIWYVVRQAEGCRPADD